MEYGRHALGSTPGLPLTEELYARLTAETPWKGNVVRLYGRWASKRDAYEWAMKTIQPACHPNILFSLGLRSDWMGNPWTLYDYAVASMTCYMSPTVTI